MIKVVKSLPTARPLKIPAEWNLGELGGIKGWSDLKRDFYVHDCRGAVPWPFDVVLGAIESS